MLDRRQRSASYVIGFILAVVATFVLASTAFAQNNDQPSPVGDVFKRVVFDPTTYAPAVITYGATMRDWNTSQPFFNNGYLERNARFTTSGLPNDRPISYQAGRQRILRDAFINLQVSLVNNVTDQVIERVLVTRYPQHRKLFRTLGWIERIGFASFMSYQLSSQHFRQANLNERRAREMGLR
jgi:hypothetical protein